MDSTLVQACPRTPWLWSDSSLAPAAGFRARASCPFVLLPHGRHVPSGLRVRLFVSVLALSPSFRCHLPSRLCGRARTVPLGLADTPATHFCPELTVAARHHWAQPTPQGWVLPTSRMVAGYQAVAGASGPRPVLATLRVFAPSASLLLFPELSRSTGSNSMFTIEISAKPGLRTRNRLKGREGTATV